jgi:hypothetical protein
MREMMGGMLGGGIVSSLGWILFTSIVFATSASIMIIGDGIEHRPNGTDGSKVRMSGAPV